MFVSIFNDVLGPVMRGPSSSHTAGSHHIGRVARSLLNEQPVAASFTFDRNGSYAHTFRQQGVDLSFAAALMEWPLTDKRFTDSLNAAEKQGIDIQFEVASLEKADHPNFVHIELTGQSGKQLSLHAKSIGGGLFLITDVNGWPVQLDGKSYVYLLTCDSAAVDRVNATLHSSGSNVEMKSIEREDKALIHIAANDSFDSQLLNELKALPGVEELYVSPPVYLVQRGVPLFESAQGIVDLAEQRGWSLGEAAMEYEKQILGMTRQQALDEMIRRFEIMKNCVTLGFDDRHVRLRLLKPSAASIMAADKENRLALGGIHTRAAARALAAMHVNNSMGTVCAAPTGGSAGVIPGFIVTLAVEKGAEPRDLVMALFAAGAIGLIVAYRATFAAEVAGCQVEIGAAGAMAAAAAVEFGKGTARQALDAAAIAFQNTMGSPCDLVQGMCEIPCHTRNAVAASSAFVCADIVLGGYENPIPLDETIDAAFSIGKMMPSALRCTSKGGLACTPAALALKPRA